jgi:hypothetical protein
MSLTYAQGQNIGGGLQAAGMAIQTGFAIGAMVDQYKFAKANIQHQIDMSNMATAHELGKIDREGQTMADMKALTSLQNASAVDVAEAEAGLSVAQAELAEAKKTNESSKLAKAKAFKAVLNKRSAYSYGRTWS